MNISIITAVVQLLESLIPAIEQFVGSIDPSSTSSTLLARIEAAANSALSAVKTAQPVNPDNNASN